MIPELLLSVVLGTYNRLPFLKLTIESIEKEVDGLSHEIVVLDGASSDGTVQWLKEQEDIVTIHEHDSAPAVDKERLRHSWGYFMNLGFRRARGKYVCMLSDDCLVVPGAIRNGIALFEDQLAAGNRVGAVAFYWRNWPEQKKYCVGSTLGNKMFVNHGLYLKQALEDVGFVDEETYSFYHADGDLCLKMWAKDYACIDSPDSYVEHYSHANRHLRRSHLSLQKQDWANYLARWKGLFYDEKKGDTGGWIEKKFDDTHRTALIFMQAAKEHPFRARVRAMGKSIARRVVSSVKRGS